MRHYTPDHKVRADQTYAEHCDEAVAAVDTGRLAGVANTLAQHLTQHGDWSHGRGLEGLELDGDDVATVAAADKMHRRCHEGDDARS